MPEEILVQVAFAAVSDERAATYQDALYYSPEEWPTDQSVIDAAQAARVAAWEAWVADPPPPPPTEPEE